MLHQRVAGGGDALVVAERLAHGCLVTRRRARGAAGDERLRGGDPRRQRLGDALAAEGVTGARRIADEQCSPVEGTERERADRRRDRPGAERPGTTRRGAEEGAERLTGEGLLGEVGEFTTRGGRVARDRQTPTLAVPVAEGEGPGVAGEQLVGERDEQLSAGGVGDPLVVGAVGVPVLGRRRAAPPRAGRRAAHRRPGAVGSDEPPCADPPAARELEHHGVAVRAQRREGVPLGDRRPGAARHLDEGGVEIDPPADGGGEALPAAEGEHGAAPRGAPQHELARRGEGGKAARVQAEALEVAQRRGREAVPAAFVAGKAGAVDDHDPCAASRRGDRRRGPRGATADDRELDLLEGRDLAGGAHRDERSSPSAAARASARPDEEKR